MLEALFPKLKSAKKTKQFLLTIADLILAFALAFLIFEVLKYFFPNLIWKYIDLLSKASIFVLSNVFGLPFQSEAIEQGVGIWYTDFLIVVIDETCSAEGIYRLYLALILAFIPKWYKKIIAFSLGVLGLMFFNTFRIFSLILIKVYFGTIYNFFHENVFVYLLYALAILFWYYFFKKSTKKKISIE